MADSYTIGTINVVANSTTVTGVNTGWETANITGGLLLHKGLTFAIASVDSETQLTLAKPYAGSTASNQSYSIVRFFEVEQITVQNAYNIATLIHDFNLGTIDGNAILTTANGGNDSDFDADLLDGQHGSYYRNASNLNSGTINNARLPDTISKTKVGTASAYFQGGYLYLDTGKHSLTHNDGNGNFQLRVGHDSGMLRTEDGGPGLLKFNNDAVDGSFELSVGPNDVTGTTATFNASLKGSFADDLTWKDHKIWHAGNDGVGSGLNADLLDGLHASQLLRTDANDTMNGILFVERNGDEQIRVGRNVDRNPYISFYNQSTRLGYIQGRSDRMRIMVDTTTDRHLDMLMDGTLLWRGHEVFHEGNDGDSSGLDADLLDGQHGSYYRNADNINAGTINNDRLPDTINKTRVGVNTAYFEAGDIIWESGHHRINNNDGGGNVNIRFGHKHDSGDKHTVANSGAVSIQGAIDSGLDGRVYITLGAAGVNVDDDVVWGPRFDIRYDGTFTWDDDNVWHDGLAQISGMIAYFARTSAPTGFLKCNGAAVSRTTYANLFEAIGTTFGVGNGSTTFNVPDLRGEFIRGLDDGRGVDSGRALGASQSDEIASHRHTIAGPSGHTHATAFGSTPVSSTFAYTPSGVNGSTGYSDVWYADDVGGVETRPRNQALLACIKY